MGVWPKLGKLAAFQSVHRSRYCTFKLGHLLVLLAYFFTTLSPPFFLQNLVVFFK